MKTTYKRYLKGSSFGTTLLLVVFSITLVFAQQKPPAPKEPVSNLKMPSPVKFQELKGRATLPKQGNLGFGLDLAEKVLHGNWDIKGKVTAVEADRVTFTTDKGEVGNLVFRLPKGLRLSLVANEAVSIKRTTMGYRAVLSYKLLVASSEKLVITSGRLFSDSPQKVKIWDSLILEQDGELGQGLKTKYETTYQVPVTLTIDGGKIELALGEAHEVIVQGKTYNVMMYQSCKVVPTKEYEGVAEGSGYVLEYVAVPK